MGLVIVDYNEDGWWMVHSVHFSNVEMFKHEENARLDASLWEKYLGNHSMGYPDELYAKIKLWEEMKKVFEERGMLL